MPKKREELYCEKDGYSCRPRSPRNVSYSKQAHLRRIGRDLQERQRARNRQNAEDSFLVRSQIINERFLDPIKIKGNMSGAEVLGLVDSGSQVNLISAKLLTRLGLQPDPYLSIVISDLTQDRTEVPGAMIDVIYRGYARNTPFFIINQLETICGALVLIGWDLIQYIIDNEGQFDFRAPDLGDRDPQMGRYGPSREKILKIFSHTFGDLVKTAEILDISVQKVYQTIVSQRSIKGMTPYEFLMKTNPDWWEDLLRHYHMQVGKMVQGIRSESYASTLNVVRDAFLFKEAKEKLKSAGAKAKTIGKTAGSFAKEKAEKYGKKAATKTKKYGRKLGAGLEQLQAGLSGEGKYARSHTFDKSPTEWTVSKIKERLDQKGLSGTKLAREVESEFALRLSRVIPQRAKSLSMSAADLKAKIFEEFIPDVTEHENGVSIFLVLFPPKPLLTRTMCRYLYRSPKQYRLSVGGYWETTAKIDITLTPARKIVLNFVGTYGQVGANTAVRMLQELEKRFINAFSN